VGLQGLSLLSVTESQTDQRGLYKIWKDGKQGKFLRG
jgi:hypothetical protein